MLKRLSFYNTATILFLACIFNVTFCSHLNAQDASAKKADDSSNGEAAVSLAEFLAEVPADQHPAKTKEFYQRDLDADLQLSETELKTALEQVKNPFWDMFIQIDTDKNGLVSKKEYVAIGGEEYRDALNREFALFDQNQDGQFSYAEFLETPRVAAKAEAKFRRWDSNTDRYLQLAEYLKRFPKEQQASVRNGFYVLEFDGDLKLSLEEFKQPPGKRQPHWKSTFAFRDVNTDGRLSHEEYYANFIGGEWEESARKEAVRFDRNADGFLTQEEFSWAPNAAKPEQRFEYYDSDQNEQLTLKEYLQASNKPQQALRIEFYRRDKNEDSLLNLKEYLDPLKDFVDTYQSRYAIRDTNGDGKLSLKEYLDPHREREWFEAIKKESVSSDVNRDGFFSLYEYAFSVDAKSPPEQRFKLLDTNSDKQLDSREYLKRFPKEQHASVRNGFYVLDFDGDLKLSLEEFKQPPGKRKIHWKSTFAARDVNTDGRLSHEEYYAPFIGGEWDKSAKKEAVLFDRNADGFLTLEEFSWSANAATPKQHFEYYDSDQNEQLALKEYLQASNKPQQALRIEFFQRDTDENSQLTLREYTETSLPVLNWQRLYALLDENSDKKLSLEEYCGASLGTKQEQTVRSQAVLADVDSDGFLALAEFALTPRANLERAERFVFLDRDNSKTLSLIEYLSISQGIARIHEQTAFYGRDYNADTMIDKAEYLSKSPARKLDFETSYLAMDTNLDGRVSTSEYASGFVGGQFEVSSKQEAANCDSDNDGYLSKLEFIHTPRPDPTESQVYELLITDNDGKLPIASLVRFEAAPQQKTLSQSAYEQRLMSLEDSVRFADKDHNGMLTQAEFTEARKNIKNPTRIKKMAREIAYQNASGESNSRLVGLLCFTLLLLIGMVWLVIRK